MNEKRKQEINEVVRNVFTSAGLDYDAQESRIVPLYEIISGYSLLITELSDNQRLTSRGAIVAVGQKNSNLLLEDALLSGFLYATQFGDVLDGWIFTEKSEPTVRRRFSAAHELGHYLLHFLPRSAEKPDENLVFTEGVTIKTNEADEKDSTIFVNEKQIGGTTKFEYELEADQFAAEILMPRNASLESARTYEKQFGTNKTMIVRRLASEFLVSFEAMFRRLKDLGFYEE